MINFNNGEERHNKFLGSEKKTTILYNNELYMLKYPDPIRGKKLRIDMDNVGGIVDSTPCISDTRKEYLRRTLGMRYKLILAPALKREINERNRSVDIEPDY